MKFLAERAEANVQQVADVPGYLIITLSFTSVKPRKLYVSCKLC